MALSASEHTLLVDTCNNMNVAAETCRQVLDMLRSLGASGVVDIATHNNALTAHAGATNLFHVNDGVAVLGDTVGGLQQFEIGKNASNAYTFVVRSYTNGIQGTKKTIGAGDVRSVNITDASGDLVVLNSLLSSIAEENKFSLFSNTATAKFSDKNLNVVENFVLGDINNTNEGKATSIIFGTCNTEGTLLSSVYLNCIEFGSIIPNAMSLGDGTHYFKDAYLGAAPVVVSDMRSKNNVASIGDEAVAFVKTLRPVSFSVATSDVNVISSDEYGNSIEVENVAGTRTHWGFLAQEVKAAMSQAGIDDAAVWCLADKDDPDSRQSLRYEELIAPIVKAVQVLAAKVEALEAR